MLFMGVALLLQTASWSKPCEPPYWLEQFVMAP